MWLCEKKEKKIILEFSPTSEEFWFYSKGEWGRSDGWKDGRICDDKILK